MIFSKGCPMCGGSVTEGTTTFSVDSDDHLVVVRHVPATCCSLCGESWLDDGIAEEMENIVRDARVRRSQLEVIDMAA